jgi:hypothetical protein
MNIQSYFYNCSWEYIDSIEPTFSSQIKDLFKKMPEAQDDKVLITNVFWMLASNGWSFSELPVTISNDPPSGLKVNFKLSEIKKQNSFDLCAASLKPDTPKYNDFAKSLNDQIIHLNIAAQESEKLTVDFTNFQLAYAEKRIPFGIELLSMQSSDPDGACFDLGVELLSMLKFDCPIWLIGLR